MKTTLTFFFLCFVTSTFLAQTNNSFDIIIGGDRTFRNLSFDEDSNTSMIDRSEEGPKLNWRVGVNFKRALSEKTYLKLGGRLSSVGYLISEEKDLRWGSEHDGMGGWAGPDPSLPHEITIYEDFLFFELPISFGLAKVINKYSLFVEGGISPNIYLASRSKEVTDINTESILQRNPNIGAVNISALMAIGIGYSLNKNVSLIVQPSFRYHFTNLVNDGFIKEYLYSYGVELGVSIVLDPKS